MNDETQLETDFVRFLGRLSAGVEWKYGRYLETEDGDANGGDFCVDCVDAVRKKRIAAKDPYHHIGGYDDAIESDCQPTCGKCGVLLRCSPTRYMVDEEVAYLSERRLKTLEPHDAAITYNWLSGMGDYSREKHWPLIKPIAKRLLLNAGIPIIPDGYVTFRPADARGHSWLHQDSVWLGIYRYFATKLIAWGGDDPPCEFLNNTSSINNHSFNPLTSERCPHRCVRNLLTHVGDGSRAAKFLASIGIKSHADFDKPITIRDQRCQWPTFSVRGRVIKGSPNSCHPDARIVTNAELQLSRKGRWCYSLFYDYNHWDRSSWRIGVSQKKGQSVAQFMESIPKWMDSVLEPEPEAPFRRDHQYRQWDKQREAIKDVFYFDRIGEDDDINLVNLLQQQDYGAVLVDHRIRLNPKRLAVLRRWIAADATAAKARDEKRQGITR